MKMKDFGFSIFNRFTYSCVTDGQKIAISSIQD